MTVRHYHADNGRFADHGFVNHVIKNRQSISYCGVNAHFQNGMAEKRIRDLQEQTTTMHAEAKWPQVITSNLWPYALREANESLNGTPSKVTGEIANQLFSGSEAPTVLRHFHPFGCPAYILNNELAAGKSIPKWQKRARLGVYLGRSPHHAQSVALILNLATGLVSPQYHLKFDDLFETVQGEETYPNRWKVATHFKKASRKDRVAAYAGRQTRGNAAAILTEGDGHALDDINGHQEPAGADPEVTVGNEEPAEEPPPLISPGTDNQEEGDPTRRWSRRHKPTQRLIESREQAAAASANRRAYMASQDSAAEETEGNDYDVDVYHGPEEYEVQRQMSDPIAFAASSDPDIMYLHEALKQPDKKEFIQAMVNEVTTHTTRGHWKIIPISEVPNGTKILPAVWAMRRKRKILTREVYKWKARLNVHGGKQTHGVDYWETYAAALKWSSIRFFLIWLIRKLTSNAICT